MKAAIFDLDGTILDSMPVWRDLGNRLCRALGFEPPENLYATVKSMTLDESADYLIKLSGYKTTKEEMAQMHYKLIKDFYENEVQLKPRVKEYLALLKEKNIPMCVATETDSTLAQKALERTGVAEYFQFCLSSKDIGKGKHFPDLYEMAAKKMGYEKEDVVIYEDACYAVRTAKKAGFEVHCIHDDSQKHDTEELKMLADHFFEDYEQYISSAKERQDN